MFAELSKLDNLDDEKPPPELNCALVTEVEDKDDIQLASLVALPSSSQGAQHETRDARYRRGREKYFQFEAFDNSDEEQDLRLSGMSLTQYSCKYREERYSHAPRKVCEQFNHLAEAYESAKAKWQQREEQAEKERREREQWAEKEKRLKEEKALREKRVWEQMAEKVKREREERMEKEKQEREERAKKEQREREEREREEAMKWLRKEDDEIGWVHKVIMGMTKLTDEKIAQKGEKMDVQKEETMEEKKEDEEDEEDYIMTLKRQLIYELKLKLIELNLYAE